MSKKTAPAAPAAGSEARYAVKLNGRFSYMDFQYLPTHDHEVDQTVLDAMEAAGVVADVKQLS